MTQTCSAIVVLEGKLQSQVENMGDELPTGQLE